MKYNILYNAKYSFNLLQKQENINVCWKVYVSLKAYFKILSYFNFISHSTFEHFHINNSERE